MEIGENWHRWKGVLGAAVEIGERVGISHENIDDAAFRIGEFVADKLDPANDEQRLLKELWETGSEEEKRNLASMVAKMSKNSKHH